MRTKKTHHWDKIHKIWHLIIYRGERELCLRFPCLGNCENVRVYTPREGLRGEKRWGHFCYMRLGNLSHLWVGLFSGELEVGSWWLRCATWESEEMTREPARESLYLRFSGGCSCRGNCWEEAAPRPDGCLSWELGLGQNGGCSLQTHLPWGLIIIDIDQLT